jgi:flagellar biosynthesis protein FlhA
MDPELTQNILQELEPKISEMSSQGLTPILLTTGELRLALRRFLEPSIPQLLVLAYQELPSETHVEPYGYIALPNQSIPTEITEQLSPSVPQDSQDAVFAQPVQ